MRKGFTLIELLVVIAIIGLLSSIVLSSLNSARDKGKDAAIKSQLEQMRSAAELIYESTGSYSTVCDASTNTGTMYRNAYANSDKVTSSDLCMTLAPSGTYTEYYSSGGALTENIGPTNSEPAGDKWAAVVLLQNGKYFCVDYKGASEEQTNRMLDNSPTTVHCQ